MRHSRNSYLEAMMQYNLAMSASKSAVECYPKGNMEFKPMTVTVLNLYSRISVASFVDDPKKIMPDLIMINSYYI